MSGQKKISGILIENNIKGKELRNSIIGIGINVNQTRFRNIPNATSIKLVSNNEIEIEQVLKKLIKNIDEHINILIVKNFDQIMNLYNSKLYGRDSCRLLINNEIFRGKVINVNPSGSINVEINGFGIKEYESNRIKILL